METSGRTSLERGSSDSQYRCPAGEIMLISGAEIARIEGTIHYILGCCQDRNAQTMVFSTGIFVSLDSPEGEALTLVRRVEARSTNLNRIYRVNEVSRKLCGGLMSPKEAYRELEEIKDSCQYKRELKGPQLCVYRRILRRGPWRETCGLPGGCGDRRDFGIGGIRHIRFGIQ